jgi:hypothetical protein
VFANLSQTIQKLMQRAGRRPMPFAALALALVLCGCGPAASLQAAANSTAAAIPVSGSSGAGALEVREYPLVEQSKDNPTHLDFQQHVTAAVAAQRDGWRFPGREEAVSAPNHALQPFGFRLEANSAPPFSGYTLYHHETALHSDIAQFWPVSVRRDASLRSTDFLLPFLTLSGEKLVASAAGIHAWPAQAEAGNGVDSSPPAYYGDQIAYAQTGGGVVSVYAGPSLLYAGSEPDTAQSAQSGSPRALHTWGSAETTKHWALELDQRVLVDGQDLAQAQAVDRAYEFHLLDGQPLYFFDKDGLTRMHYAGSDLPYSYDQIIYQNTGDLAVFNPGSTGRVLWYYALRDGLWYYVEAGIFD